MGGIVKTAEFLKQGSIQGGMPVPPYSASQMCRRSLTEPCARGGTTDGAEDGSIGHLSWARTVEPMKPDLVWTMCCHFSAAK